jgi:ABC-2 type transport system permease protein
MIAILKKEIDVFFSTPIGYLVIAVFLLVNGLFLWVFNGDFNILNAGFADLNSFFFLAPWFFVFIIPAMTMRSFSDEIRLGTIEILKTSPVSSWEIILGKYLGSLLLILIALIPTVSYVYTVIQLAATPADIDFASIIGSYVGLMFLASGFTAIGLLASVLSSNQIVSFIIGVALSFAMYYGFQALGDLDVLPGLSLENWGMSARYRSMGRGVIDTRDVLYFLSVAFVFLYLTKLKFEQK